VQKEAEKMLKYKSSGLEIQRMWNLIGATGIVTKTVREKPGSYTRKTFD
jgi:hypothetical protein